MRGAPVARENDFAAAIPTRSAPTRPGPTVTATPSMSPTPTSAATRASASSGVSASTWARAATSGTTPPNRSWRWTWAAIMFVRTLNVSSTIATAVSSQLVSIPSVITEGRTPSGSAAAIAASRSR